MYAAKDGFKWFGSRDGLRGRDVTSILLDEEGFFRVRSRGDGMSGIVLESCGGTGYACGVPGDRKQAFTDELEDKGGFVY